MNLFAAANSAVAAINSPTIATLSTASGSTTDPTGHRTPTYIQTTVSAQIQALSGRELAQINNLNIQGVLRAAYVGTEVDGEVRISAKGGDLLTFAATKWLVVQVLETWPNWSKVVISMQTA